MLPLQRSRLVTKRHEPRKAFQLSSRPCAACTESIKQDELRMRQAEEAELQCMLEKRSHEMASRTISYESLPDDVCVLLLAIDVLIGSRLANGTFKENECDALAPYGSGCFFRRLREDGLRVGVGALLCGDVELGLVERGGHGDWR